MSRSKGNLITTAGKDSRTIRRQILGHVLERIVDARCPRGRSGIPVRTVS